MPSRPCWRASAYSKTRMQRPRGCSRSLRNDAQAMLRAPAHSDAVTSLAGTIIERDGPAYLVHRCLCKWSTVAFPVTQLRFSQPLIEHAGARAGSGRMQPVFEPPAARRI